MGRIRAMHCDWFDYPRCGAACIWLLGWTAACVASEARSWLGSFLSTVRTQSHRHGGDHPVRGARDSRCCRCLEVARRRRRSCSGTGCIPDAMARGRCRTGAVVCDSPYRNHLDYVSASSARAVRLSCHSEWSHGRRLTAGAVESGHFSRVASNATELGRAHNSCSVRILVGGEPTWLLSTYFPVVPLPIFFRGVWAPQLRSCSIRTTANGIQFVTPP